MPRVPARRSCSIVDSASLALVVVACVLMLWAAAPAPAAASSHTRPSASAAAHRLSTTPPVPLDATHSGHSTAATHRASTAAAAGAATGTRLPATGYDVATIALLGAGMVAAGLGLRRLSADGRRV